MARGNLERPDIATVARYYGAEIPGLRAGGWTKIRCLLPSHDDRHPSASMNASINKWTCAACDFGEDSFDILMREEGISLGQARLLAEERGWLTRDKASKPAADKSQASLFGKGSGGTAKRAGLF